MIGQYATIIQMLHNPTATTKKRLLKGFQPDYIADSVAAIDFGYLAEHGIKAALIDLDGTVVTRGNYDVGDTVAAALKNQPLAIYIATNRPKSRDLKDLKSRLGADGVLHPHGIWGKPFPTYYRQSVRDHGLKPSETIMIGDRYLQDIWGSNLAGLHSLAVHKLGEPTNWFDRLLSGIERRHTRRLSKRYRTIG